VLVLSAVVKSCLQHGFLIHILSCLLLAGFETNSECVGVVGVDVMNL
jgi:hypothetical protein